MNVYQSSEKWYTYTYVYKCSFFIGKFDPDFPLNNVSWRISVETRFEILIFSICWNIHMLYICNPYQTNIQHLRLTTWEKSDKLISDTFCSSCWVGKRLVFENFSICSKNIPLVHLRMRLRNNICPTLSP